VEYTPHDSDVTVAVVAPRTGKIIKNERGENLLQNGILHFVFKPIRNRVTKLQFTQTEN